MNLIVSVMLLWKIFVISILVISFLSSVLSIKSYKRLNVSLRAFALFVISGFIFEAISYYTNIKGLNNLYLFHLYTINMLLWLSIFYYYAMVRLSSQIIRWIYLFACLICLCFILYNSIFLQGLNVVNGNAKAFVQAFFLITSVCFIFFIFDLDIPESAKRILNFFNSAILVFTSGSLCIFLFSDYITTLSMPSQQVIYVSVAGVNLIGYFLILIGTYLNSRDSKERLTA